MYSRTHKVIRSSFHNLKRNTSTSTFSLSQNSPQKDLVRLVFMYGMCGTFASYLNMEYDGKLLVIQWSSPTPQRFIFCTWCWCLAGITSWKFLWTRPDSLIRAAQSRIRHGFIHGSQTTVFAMCWSFSTIAFWSCYFDINEYRNSFKEWQTASHPSLMTQNASAMGQSSVIIEEETNDDLDEIDEDSNNNTIVNNMDSGVKIIADIIGKKNEKNLEKEIKSKPNWKWQNLMANMYEPCKSFFMCNAPIWALSGGLTGVLAARVLTNALLLNPIHVTTAIAVCQISQFQENYKNDIEDNPFTLLDDDDDQLVID